MEYMHIASIETRLVCTALGTVAMLVSTEMERGDAVVEQDITRLGPIGETWRKERIDDGACTARELTVENGHVIVQWRAEMRTPFVLNKS